MPDLIFIDDANWSDHVQPPPGQGMGLVPRDYETHGLCSSPYSQPFDALQMPLIPRNEWVERIREMEATKSRLSDIRRTSGPGGGPIPSLDQGQTNFCWTHSGTAGVMLCRAKANLPYVRLSACMPACILNNYKNQGGWGAWGLEFLVANGVPDVQYWPERSLARSNDTPAMRANAALHKVSEAFVDLVPPVYDRNLSEDQAMTCLLNRIPVISDFMWWRHSVLSIDPTITRAAKYHDRMLATDFGSLDLNKPDDRRVLAAAFGKRILNSWSDSWSDLGEGILEGEKAIIDGGAAVRVTTASLT